MFVLECCLGGCDYGEASVSQIVGSRSSGLSCGASAYLEFPTMVVFFYPTFPSSLLDCFFLGATT
jgi:hypothetical protein